MTRRDLEPSILRRIWLVNLAHRTPEEELELEQLTTLLRESLPKRNVAALDEDDRPTMRELATLARDRLPSSGALRVHGAKMGHVIGKLDSLRPLDDEGLELLTEAATLLSFAQAWALGVDPSDGEVDRTVVEADIDRLYRRVFNPAGYVDRRLRLALGRPSYSPVEE